MKCNKANGLGGAGRGNRTPMDRSPADFESAASASSAIPAEEEHKQVSTGRPGRAVTSYPSARVAEFSDLVGLEICLGRRIVLQVGVPEGDGLELLVLEVFSCDRIAALQLLALSAEAWAKDSRGGWSAMRPVSFVFDVPGTRRFRATSPWQL